MRTIAFLFISIFAIMDTSGQNIQADRQPVAAGRYYSADKNTLDKDITKHFKECLKTDEIWDVRAIISPHAGYVFSGNITASAFSAIPRKTKYKNIFIIGSSHIMAFDGASVYSSGDFITPLGRVKVNRSIASKLITGNKVFRFPADAHLQEHSLEVQLPFIQYYFKSLPDIVPIIIGTTNRNTIKQIAESLQPWFNEENLFVISSDFSHYPSYQDAVEVDFATAQAIITGDPSTFLNTLKDNSSRHISGLATSMCGWTSGLVLLYLTQQDKQLEYKLIDYCNSGDTPYGNKAEVVGYNAIAVIERNSDIRNKKEEENSFIITRKETDNLFTIARNSIRSQLFDNRRYEIDERMVTDNMRKSMGAFVTLKIDGILRGCIGRFISSEPLYKVVQTSAISSAFEDPRFTPLTRKEYEKTEIEITVLGPMKKIDSINEIELGKHGIYIKKDMRSGTMLPQVATEQGWSTEEFLGYTSRDKAGLGWDGWRDAEIYIYEGIVLKDN